MTMLPAMDPLVPPLPRPSAPALIVVAPVYRYRPDRCPSDRLARTVELRDHPRVVPGTSTHG